MPSEQNDVLQGSLIHTHFILFLIFTCQVAFCGCPKVIPTTAIEIWNKVHGLKAWHLKRRIECTWGQFSPPVQTEFGPKFGF